MADPINPTADAPTAPESTSPELAALMESVTKLGEELQGINARLSGFEEVITAAPEEPPAPVDPTNDPDNLPPATWKALREEFRNEAERKAEEKLNERMQKEREEADSKAQFEQNLNKQFDDLADEAVKKGFLPAVTNEDDANDPGKVARRELFGYAAKLGSVNLVEVAENLKNLHDNGQHYDVESGKIIGEKPVRPGKTAPVGSSSSRTTGERAKIDYKILHTTSLDALARRAMQE